MSQVENSAELEQKSGELAEDFGRVNYIFCWIVKFIWQELFAKGNLDSLN